MASCVTFAKPVCCLRGRYEVSGSLWLVWRTRISQVVFEWAVAEVAVFFLDAAVLSVSLCAFEEGHLLSELLLGKTRK